MTLRKAGLSLLVVAQLIHCSTGQMSKQVACQVLCGDPRNEPLTPRFFGLNFRDVFGSESVVGNQKANEIGHEWRRGGDANFTTGSEKHIIRKIQEEKKKDEKSWSINFPG